MHFIEEEAIFFLTREGFYPKLGSLTTGSGFAAGVGYRNSGIFNRYGIFDVYAAGSMKKYWALEGSATFPRLADGKLYARVYGGRREYPEEDFFGLGPDSRRGDQVSFALTTNRFGGNVGVRPVEPLMVGGGVELLQPYVGRGKDKLVPTIGDVFDDSHGARPQRAAGFPAHVGVRRGELQRAGLRAQGRVVSRGVQPHRRIAIWIATRSIASTSICGSSSRSSPSAA